MIKLEVGKIYTFGTYPPKKYHKNPRVLALWDLNGGYLYMGNHDFLYLKDYEIQKIERELVSFMEVMDEDAARYL